MRKIELNIKGYHLSIEGTRVYIESDQGLREPLLGTYQARDLYQIVDYLNN